MAVEEITAGVGRPVKYVAMDNKGDTSLSVEAFRKLVMEDKAKLSKAGRKSDIVQEASGQMAKQYPHIFVFNGFMGAELTARIIDQAPKYDHNFRDWDPEPAHYAQTKYFFCKPCPSTRRRNGSLSFGKILPGRRNGVRISYINLPTWEKWPRNAVWKWFTAKW